MRFGARHASTANCSSSGLKSRSRASPSTWSNDRRRPARDGEPSLHNHAPDIAAMDLFVVPTIGFDLLYAFVIVRLGRRDLVWINVTANPTAEWLRVKSRKHFLGTRLRTTSSATATGSMAASSRADCAPWASGTSLSRQPRPGRMGLSNG